MLRLTDLKIIQNKNELEELPDGKILINTINAHSFNTAQHDALFAESLACCDALIPDGASIVKACRWLGAKSQPTERIAGWDLFIFEMTRLENTAAQGTEKSVMFLGSSETVLSKIKEKCSTTFPHLRVITFSPPYKEVFSDEDNAAIINAVNSANPDLLWIGMTAPKQEKWTYTHWADLHIHCHTGTVGAVFDFFAGTAHRAPLWWQRHSLEWLYRLIMEPRRMWRRYLLGNPLFIYNVLKQGPKTHPCPPC